MAIGADGTNVNTGWKAGAIALLENKLKQALQWLICLLHNNELPLRHLFEFIDESTSGPTSYSGPIGKTLTTCTELSVVGFQNIETEIPDVDVKILSKDQKYMLELALAIKTRMCSENLAERDPCALKSFTMGHNR
ncbi:unnamed protein product [Bemisia tabaci]|uniref:Uncharacterized protein n=1 Tax=Bemisia tabaci TaxID=7038 RepID=A0A9P0A1M3_BEMTA|nr:unnamed protein product [Bemisia tabaci]